MRRLLATSVFMILLVGSSVCARPKAPRGRPGRVNAHGESARSTVLAELQAHLSPRGTDYSLIRTFDGLVLQGGGALGTAYIGALETLGEHLQVSRVAGTSAGAIVGSLYASGLHRGKLSELFLRTDFRDLVRIEALSHSWASWARGLLDSDESTGQTFLDKRLTGIYETSMLGEWLDEKLGGERSFSTFCGNRTDCAELYIPALCLETGELTWFSKDTSPHVLVSTAVRASAAIPFLFQPVEIDEKHYVDGGLIRNFPTDGFLHKQSLGLRVREAPGLWEWRPGALLQRLIDVTLFGPESSNAGPNPPGLQVMTIQASHSPDTEIFAKRERIKELLTTGREGAEEWMTRHEMAGKDGRE